MILRACRALPAWRVTGSAVLLAVVCVVLLVGSAAPARAHGPTPDGTDYRSRVTDIVGASDGAARPVDAVTWRVLGGDGLLQVTATDGVDVVVEGYDDEPYVRVGPDGVFENRNSPATYLNADRYAGVAVPADVAPAAAPDWRQVSAASTWQWHDHRIHWMAPTPPPQVRDRPDVAQRVLTWEVPFEVDGEQLQVRGVLDYIPPPSVWPLLVMTAVVLSVPVVVLAAAGAGQRRALGSLVVVTIAVAVAGVAVAVGDALATPVSLGANAWAVLQSAVPAAIAGALAWTARHPRRSDDAPRPEATLLVAALVVAFAVGLSRLTQLTSSVVTNALPADLVRVVVAASLVLAVPSVLALLVARRAGDDRDAATAQQG